MALVSDEEHAHEGEHYRFVSLAQSSETGETPRARVVFEIGGMEFTCQGEGDGPVDATVNAIEKQAASGAELVLFSINAISNGTQSQGRGHDAAVALGAHRQWGGGRSGHHRGVGQGVHRGAEQAALEDRAGQSAAVVRRGGRGPRHGSQSGRHEHQARIAGQRHHMPRLPGSPCRPAPGKESAHHRQR